MNAAPSRAPEDREALDAYSTVVSTVAARVGPARLIDNAPLPG